MWGFVLIFWGRGPLLLWLSIRLALVKKGTCRVPGGRSCCKWLKPSLYVMYCSLKFADGRGKKWHQPSLFSGEGISCLPLFLRPSEKGEQSPPLWPRLPSDPHLHSICIWSVCRPVGAAFLCFNSDAWLGFKIPDFGDLGWGRRVLILWGRVSLFCGW